jgi:hypothetical protein
MNSVWGSALAAVVGGPYAIGGFALRHMGQLSWASLAKWMLAMFAIYAVGATVMHGVIGFSEQLRIERELTATSVLKAASCAGMDEVMLYDPAVYAVCIEARRVAATWPVERALTHMGKQWPSPMHLLSVVANSTEKQFYTLCVVATLGLTVWQALAPLRWQAVERVDRRRAQLAQQQYAPPDKTA